MNRYKVYCLSMEAIYFVTSLKVLEAEVKYSVTFQNLQASDKIYVLHLQIISLIYTMYFFYKIFTLQLYVGS